MNIFVKERLETIKEVINVVYYDVEKLKDLDYLIILFADKALKNNESLEKSLLEFTKGENDIFLILKRRFKKLFSQEIEDIEIVKNEIILSKENKVKYVKKIKNIKVPFLDLLNKYFYEEMFYSKDELEEIIKNKFVYGTKSITFETINEKNDKMFTFSLNKDLNKFDLLNIRENDNSIILDKLKNNLIKQAITFLPKDFKNYEKVNMWNNELLQLNRDYTEESTKHINLINLKDNFSNLKIEYLKNDENLLISSFFIFDNLPLVKEEKISFPNFKNSTIYSNFLNTIENSFKEFNQFFRTTFIKNANTKEELVVIKNKNFIRDLKKDLLIKKTDLMIRENINILNESLVTLTTNEILNSIEYINYYKFICYFENNYWINIEEKDKMLFWNKINKSNPNLLVDNHKRELIKYIENKKNIYSSIKSLLNNQNENRENVKDAISEIIKIISDIEKENNNPKINDEIKKGNDEWKIKLENEKKLLTEWKNIFNFYTHFSNKSNKGKFDYNKQSFEKSTFDFLIDLKERIHKIDNNNEKIENYNIGKNDIDKLIDINQKFIIFKDEFEEKNFKLK